MALAGRDFKVCSMNYLIYHLLSNCITLVHLGHRILLPCLETVRISIYGITDEKSFHVPGGKLSDPVDLKTLFCYLLSDILRY